MIYHLILVRSHDLDFGPRDGEYRFYVLEPPRIALSFAPMKCKFVSDDTTIPIDLLEFR